MLINNNSTMANIVGRINRIDEEYDEDSIFNRIALLYAVGYNGTVVVTMGNYIGERKVVVSGYCYEILSKLREYPVLSASHLDPNGMTVNNRYGLPAAEFFATLYHGEK